MNAGMITLQDITKTYRMGEVEVHALAGVSLQVKAGEMVAIMGPSGSGKSTLMNILGCLDTPTSGQYVLDGIDVSSLNDDRLADIRGRKLGFIFQAYNLVPRTTALENVELPMIYTHTPNRRQRAVDALTRVGLADRLHHRPSELSGGQQQRVAIARSLVNNPSVMLADEPTGNLDSKSGTEIMDLLHSLHEQGLTIVIVTHDGDVAAQTQRIIRVRDGTVVGDEQVSGNGRSGTAPAIAGRGRPSE